MRKQFMKTIKIAHFDDTEDPHFDVSSRIITLNRKILEKFPHIKIDEVKEYMDHKKFCEDIKSGVEFNLVILDMFDDNTGKPIGDTILNCINGKERKIPTIIFTQATVKGITTDFKTRYNKFPFILGDKITKDDLDGLIERIEEHIINSEIDEDFFEIDIDDIFLRAEIMAIGKKNLNEILYKIKHYKKVKDKFIIERMSSGFSGAAVFKLKYDNQTSVLKISRDIETLKEEHKRALKSYLEFPSQLRINIKSKPYFNSEVLAILIENVGNSVPLFDWLKINQKKEKIGQLFKNLFLDNGLKEHYKDKRSEKKENKFPYIFTKFNDIRFSMVRKAIKELKPIIEGKEFDESNIKNLIENRSFKKIDKENLLDDKYKKELVLCHGDFHSNNILIQGNNPVIIDTGGIEYDYWCMDICRLIVHLFIVGFDKNTYDYYDLNKIDENLEIAEKIISLQQIELDGINDGFIYAINWLLENVENIYDDLFSKWEFQLGLMKEFLQASYKTYYILPNKRAIALLSAYQCMLSANEEVEKETKD